MPMPMPPPNVEQFQVSARFCGPPRSGNGGYVAGRIAAALPGPVTVRLKAPPPLQADLRLETQQTDTGPLARLFQGEVLIGEGKPSPPLTLDVPPCPTADQAEAAVSSYLGFKVHAFPGCFVCGPNRAVGDGLRIFPGALSERDGHVKRQGQGDVIAAPWRPDASLADDTGVVRPEFVWSALDCTGAFTVLPRSEGLTCVLGEFTAQLLDTVKPGERCVAMGWPLGGEGRKRLAGSAVYGEGGRLVGVARAVWVDVPASDWT